MNRYGRNLILLVLIALPVLTGCRRNRVPVPDPEVYRTEIETWRAKRLNNLKAPKGWLNLAGLYWLHNGLNTFGSDTANDIVFPPKAPPFIGTLALSHDSVFLRSTFVPVYIDSIPANNLLLKDDASDSPDMMTSGTYAWNIIRRSDRFGIRLRDFENPMIDSLSTIPYFEISEKWRIVAEFKPYPFPEKHKVQNVIGTEEENLVPGELHFKVKGKKCILYPFTSGNELFIVFGDLTNGSESYPAGRFLYTPGPDENNMVIIDFNKAYNPPCAFTPYATCPLPLRKNILPVNIEAGEKAVHLSFN